MQEEDNFGDTFLHKLFAEREDKSTLEIGEFALRNGVNINIKNDKNRTLLDSVELQLSKESSEFKRKILKERIIFLEKHGAKRGRDL